jgi:hypothetical protein
MPRWRNCLDRVARGRDGLVDGEHGIRSGCVWCPRPNPSRAAAAAVCESCASEGSNGAGPDLDVIDCADESPLLVR